MEEEKDIAPTLLEALQKAFRDNLAADQKGAALLKRIQSGEGTYETAGDYAEQIGSALAKAFRENLSSEVLPDGKMYGNIADRVIRPLIGEDYQLTADAAAKVQQALNEAAGLGLKAKVAPLNEDRVNGFLNTLANAEQYDDVAYMLDEPVLVNFTRSIVDETVRVNADFHYRAGLGPRIVRRAEHKACAWCQKLAGSFDYPDDIPDGVFQRHENCRCVVEYDPGDGRRQNAHTKKWTEPGERDIIEDRKRAGLDSIDTFRPAEYKEKIERLVKVENIDAVVDASRSGKRHGHGGVYYDAVRKSKKQLQKSIISRTAQVERHMDKIQNPESYVPDWNEKSKPYRDGTIRKWEKDMRRNAEQAEIELAILKERFGK